MNIFTLLFSYFFFINSALAGLPPTTAQGQSEATKPTTFFFQAPYNQFTTTGSSQRLLENGNENLLLNTSFEAGTLSGWTNGSFTYTDVTSIVSSGKHSAGFTVNNTGTVLTQTLTPAIKEAARNFIAYAWIASGNTSIVGAQVCAMVGGVETDCTQAVETGNSNFQYVPVPFNTSGTDSVAIGIRVKSTSATSRTLYVDQTYVGLLSLGSSTVDTGFVNYGAIPITAVSANPTKGTTTTDQFIARRSGPNLVGYLSYHQSSAGSAGTGDYLFGVPAATGCTIDPVAAPYNTGIFSTITTGIGGGFVNASAASGYGATFVPYDSIHMRIFSNVTSSPSVFQPVGSGWFDLSNNPDGYAMYFNIPCAGWGSLNAISPAQSASTWSGYHDNTCSWARTNTAYGDPTADATCSLVQRTNSNFGTVTTYNSAGSALPGIVITPVATGAYFVCSSAKVIGASLAAIMDIQLWDGTTVVATAEETAFVAAEQQFLPICGIINMIAGTPKTLSLQTKSTSGTVTIAANSTNVSSVEWSVVNLTYSTPSPLLANTVVSTSLGVSLFDSARLTCGNTGSAIVNQSAAWSVANGASAGLCTVTISPSFSAEPNCSCTVIAAGSASAQGCGFSAISSTTLSVTRTAAGAATNGDVEIVCRGNK